tara:strand:+ start:509 stop:700 length:192 start_codon:yes stop_codon:yes gene_type:complete
MSNSKNSLFSNIIKSVNVSQLPEQKKFNKISIKSKKIEKKEKQENKYLDHILNNSFLIDYFKS